MAGTKMSQLFIGSLVICFVLLPLVAARTVDTQTLKDAKLVSSREISTEFELEPPRGRSVYQVVSTSNTDTTPQSNDEKSMTDKKERDIIENLLHNIFGFNYTKNCSDTDAVKQAMGAIFGKLIQEDLEFAHFISEIVGEALKEEAISEAFECIFKQILKKKQEQDEEMKEAFQAILKEMLKHKLGGHYDKDLCKGMEALLKEIFLKTPPLDSKIATDEYLNTSLGCYAHCTTKYHTQ